MAGRKGVLDGRQRDGTADGELSERRGGWVSKGHGGPVEGGVGVEVEGVELRL